jgi:hypothetical protein
MRCYRRGPRWSCSPGRARPGRTAPASGTSRARCRSRGRRSGRTRGPRSQGSRRTRRTCGRTRRGWSTPPWRAPSDQPSGRRTTRAGRGTSAGCSPRRLHDITRTRVTQIAHRSARAHALKAGTTSPCQSTVPSLRAKHVQMSLPPQLPWPEQLLGQDAAASPTSAEKAMVAKSFIICAPHPRHSAACEKLRGGRGDAAKERLRARAQVGGGGGVMKKTCLEGELGGGANATNFLRV